MTYDLDRLETLASDRKRWPTMGEIGELRHGALALIARIRELETTLETHTEPRDRPFIATIERPSNY